MEAAFFDLDRTVIAKASMVAFSRPLLSAGMLNRWLALRAVYAQLIYQYLGADEDRMARMREAALKVTVGWEQQRILDLVRETLEEVIEPIIYAEALDLIRRHQAEGRRVYLVSASPERMALLRTQAELVLEACEAAEPARYDRDRVRAAYARRFG